MRRKIKRTFYRDKWNEDKVWEVSELIGGYYLRQYVCGKQWGSGMKTTRNFIENIGIFGFEQIPAI